MSSSNLSSFESSYQGPITVEIPTSSILDQRLMSILEGNKKKLDDELKFDIILYCSSLKPAESKTLLGVLEQFSPIDESVIDNLKYLKEILSQHVDSLKSSIQKNAEYKKKRRVIGFLFPNGGEKQRLFDAKRKSIEAVFCLKNEEFNKKLSELNPVDAFKLLEPFEIREFEDYTKSHLTEMQLSQFEANLVALRDNLKETMCKELIDFVTMLSEEELKLDAEFLQNKGNEKLLGLKSEIYKLTKDQISKFHKNTNLLKHASIVTSLLWQHKKKKEFLDLLTKKQQTEEERQRLTTLSQELYQEFDKIFPESLVSVIIQERSSSETTCLAEGEKTLLNATAIATSKLDETFAKTIDEIGRLDPNVSSITLPDACVVESLEIASSPKTGTTDILSLTIFSKKNNHKLMVEEKSNATNVTLQENGSNKELAMKDLVLMAYEQWLKSKTNKPITFKANKEDTETLKEILSVFIQTEPKFDVILNGEQFKRGNSSAQDFEELKEKMRKLRVQADKRAEDDFMEPIASQLSKGV